VSRRRALRVLAYTDSSSVGGAELALGYLLGALAPTIEVGLLAVDGDVGEAIGAHRPGVEIRVVRAPRRTHDHAALFAHLRAIRGFAPDLMHANQSWPWACGYGELAALLTPGVRVLAVDHLPIIGAAIPRRRLIARQKLARRLNAHVSVGERSARLIEEIVGLSPGSVDSVPNGVPALGIEPAVRSRRVAASAPVIGSLGRLTDQKGYERLVRTLPHLPAASLVLVGDGPEREALQGLAAELGVAQRLTITGWTSDARGYLSTFDVFALPSSWEGMPLSILEAMHAGLPVVASDVGSVAEAVSDGETGFVIGAGDDAMLLDRLVMLLSDPELRARLGSRARVIARERFTDTAMAARYEAIYGAMLNR
jgi:glycosyltransferase involved in cell wall biosynthesis